MNLSTLQATIAPLAAPVAPAIILGSQVYAGMTAGAVPGWLAVTGAIGSGVGMELAGALMFSMALVLLRRRAWMPAAMAVVGILAYTAFVMLGVSTAVNGGAFMTYVGASLVAFGAAGLWQYVRDTDTAQAGQVAVMRAHAAELRAQAKANASAMSTGRPDKPADNRTVKMVRDYYAQNPTATVRQAAEALGIGKSTVAEYKKKL